MPPRPVPAELFGGRLTDAFLLALEVTGAEHVAQYVRSITFASPDLVGFEQKPGQDLQFQFAGVRRRYTIRRADPLAGTAEIQVELHPAGGPATAWARAVAPGDRVDAIGPRGKIATRPDAPAHLFIADDSSMPAAFAMLEALPATTSATALLVTAHGADSRPGPAALAPATLTWLEPAHLAASLEQLELAPATAAYVLGELGLVRSARELLEQAGLSPEAIATKAYWRRDKSNAENGEP